MFQRLEGCTLQALQDALYREKRLLQAWSFRGAPVVFPTRDSGVFLTPLAAREGEQPWIYTRGISGALEFLGMTFEELLPRVRTAAGWLEGRTVKSKEELDRVLAARVTDTLPEEKRPLLGGLLCPVAGQLAPAGQAAVGGGRGGDGAGAGGEKDPLAAPPGQGGTAGGRGEPQAPSAGRTRPISGYPGPGGHPGG